MFNFLRTMLVLPLFGIANTIPFFFQFEDPIENTYNDSIEPAENTIDSTFLAFASDMTNNQRKLNEEIFREAIRSCNLLDEKKIEYSLKGINLKIYQRQIFSICLPEEY